MLQEVTVKNILPDGYAQVEMKRISACGENCAMCGGCADPRAFVTVAALNKAGANRGDKVIVSSGTGKIMKAAAIVYLVPLILFFLMYFTSSLLFDSGAMLAGGVGFVAGILVMWLYNRRVNKTGEITFTVTEITARGQG